jgi:hypothetical protein
MFRSNDKQPERVPSLSRWEYWHHAAAELNTAATHLPFGYGVSASFTVQLMTGLAMIHFR